MTITHEHLDKRMDQLRDDIRAINDHLRERAHSDGQMQVQIQSNAATAKLIGEKVDRIVGNHENRLAVVERRFVWLATLWTGLTAALGAMAKKVFEI